MNELNKYNILANEMKKFLSKEEYISNSERINLHDLFYCVVKDTLEMYESLYGKNDLQKQLNKNISRFDRLFNKVRYNVRYGGTNKNLNILIDINSKQPLKHNSILINKEIGTDDLYFANNSSLYYTTRQIIQNNYDTIMQNFATLEEHSYLFNSENKLEVTDDIYKVTFIYNKDDGVKIDINANGNKETEEIFNRDYYSKDNLYKLSKSHQKDILKRISVDINELPTLYKFAAQKYINKEKVKVKSRG